MRGLGRCRTLLSVSSRSASEQRLRDAFESYATRVLAYALRHAEPDTAHDVLSEVFLTAWRRIEDMPAEPLPWLFVITQNTLRNSARGSLRRLRLAERMAAIEGAAASTPGAEETVLERQIVLGALAELSDHEREALLLTSWDGLSPAQAAVVVGCSRRAFDARLGRARARLRRELHDEPSAHESPPARATAAPSNRLATEITP